jgi:hypothetical protein
MTKELEALLTELYVLIDDQVVEPRHGRGRRPELSDSELLCLAVAQILLGFHSERRWVRHAHGNADLRRMFPYLPQQPKHHKRLKSARGLLCNTIRVLARVCPSWSDDLWITDATSVPCGTSRETVKRHHRQDEPGRGRGELPRWARAEFFRSAWTCSRIAWPRASSTIDTRPWASMAPAVRRCAEALTNPDW